MIHSVALQNAAGPSNAAALKDSSKEPLQAAQSTRNRNAEAMIPIESKKVSSPSHQAFKCPNGSLYIALALCYCMPDSVIEVKTSHLLNLSFCL